MRGTVMRVLAVVICSCFAAGLPAQIAPPKPFSRIWCKPDAKTGVTVIFDGIMSHQPAFVGEDGRRARLGLLNAGTVPAFIQAFDLTAAADDSALLHDVFAKEQCQEVRKQHPNYNPSGALGLGYSRIDTSSIVEVAPGSTFHFSVPLDHLSRGRCVRVRYWVGTERRPTSDAGYHFIWFGPSPP
jgi:hypothetical protein